MRKIAKVPQANSFDSRDQSDSQIKRVMICLDTEGCYLFLYDRLEDGPCCADELFDSADDAVEVCQERFAIDTGDWEIIMDHPPGCQSDWIRPTRMKMDNNGQPIYGQFVPHEE